LGSPWYLKEVDQASNRSPTSINPKPSCKIFMSCVDVTMNAAYWHLLIGAPSLRKALEAERELELLVTPLELTLVQAFCSCGYTSNASDGPLDSPEL
jgi:hypothetical protein